VLVQPVVLRAARLAEPAAVLAEPVVLAAVPAAVVRSNANYAK
jgi:hypothetical protein